MAECHHANHATNRALTAATATRKTPQDVNTHSFAVNSADIQKSMQGSRGGFPHLAASRSGRDELRGRPAAVCLPLHQTIPDTTGSPEVVPPPAGDNARKRPADEANATRSPAGPARPPKRQRRMYTQEQIHLLEKTFLANEYPTSEDRVLLSSVTELSTEKVKVWFQNRRSRERRRRQNQVHNDTAMKQIGMLQAVQQQQQKPQPPYHQAASVKPYAGSVGVRSSTLTSSASASTQQPWLQLWPQSRAQVSSYPPTSHACPTATPHPMATDDNNNEVHQMGLPPGAVPSHLKPEAAGLSGAKHHFAGVYTKMRTASGTTPMGTGGVQEAAGLGPGKRDLEPSYTSLVPAWSQSWQMFSAPPAASTMAMNMNMNTAAVQKVLPLCQPAAEPFCGNTSKWVENHSHSHHHTHHSSSSSSSSSSGSSSNNNNNSGYGLPPAEADNKALQEHYAYAAAAMLPAGYLHYGYPYYSPGMYQPPQVGLYSQQPHVAPPCSSIGAYHGGEMPPASKVQHPSIMSQSVRLALQRKIDNSQKNQNYAWQAPAYSSPPQQQQHQPAPGFGRLQQPPYLDLTGKAGENDAFSDSSTLSSPERGGSPSKPLATSSPTGAAPSLGLPFSLGDKDGGQELLGGMGALHDPWTQAHGGMGVETMDKNNNMMDLALSTPYPNVAGYCNDYAPLGGSPPYGQTGMSGWGTPLRMPGGGGGSHFPYKLPEWPPPQHPADRPADDQAMSAGVGMESAKSESDLGGYPPYTLAASLHPDPAAPPQHQPHEITPCKDYQAPSAQMVADMVRSVCGGGAVHSDISSYESSGCEQEEQEEQEDDDECCEMAPPAIKSERDTITPDNTQVPATSGGSPLVPSRCEYGIGSDTE